MKQFLAIHLKYTLAALLLAGIHPYPQKTNPTELPATVDTRPSIANQNYGCSIPMPGFESGQLSLVVHLTNRLWR